MHEGMLNASLARVRSASSSMPRRMDPLEGAEVGLACQCGSENFERVLVRRAGKDPHSTDFVACIGCKAVFHLPAHTIMSDPEFKNNAAHAAGACRKPGRR